MAAPSADGALTHHSPEEARSLIDQLCDAYADAYGVEPDDEKTGAFRTRASRQFGRLRFDLVTARFEAQLVGFAFGYTLSEGTGWWDRLEPEPPKGFNTEHGSRTFVLSEIEVRRAWQGKGIGKALHDALLGGRSEERATLATGPAADSQPAYFAWGWHKVGRVPGVHGDYYSAYDLFVIPLPLGGRA
jgi:GNAT superfamily N-acetyltransferase